MVFYLVRVHYIPGTMDDAEVARVTDNLVKNCFCSEGGCKLLGCIGKQTAITREWENVQSC